MFIVDGHLNLAYDALVNGRNLQQPLQCQVLGDATHVGLGTSLGGLFGAADLLAACD